MDLLELAGYAGDAAGTAADMFLIRPSTREMVFQQQGTLNIPGVKTELQTQVTYFHHCHKDLDLTRKKARLCIQGIWM